MVWTSQLDYSNRFYGRSKDELDDIQTCGDPPVNNLVEFSHNGDPREVRRITGQANLLYGLNLHSTRIDTIKADTCPAGHTESEFDYQEVEDIPLWQHGRQDPTGISTDDGLVMYFSFSSGEIRHISKLLPTLVGNSHAITVRENTKGVHEPGEHRAGRPFRADSEQIIGDYSWHLRDRTDAAKSTTCGGTPDAGNDSDAASFDCRSSGSRQQSFQLLTRNGTWLDYEEQQSYTFRLVVRDVDSDIDTMTVTVNLEDVDERPAGPSAPTLSNERQQAITVAWQEVTTLQDNATPRTDLDQISGYEVEYTPQGGTSSTQKVSGGGTVQHDLSGLMTDTRYSIRVRALNGHDQGPWSLYSIARTLPNPKPELVDTSFTVEENTPSTDFTVEGETVGLSVVDTLTATDTDAQDEITGYIILETTDDHEAFQLVHSSDGTEADLGLVDIPDFEQQESYTIIIRTTSGTGLREEHRDEEVTVTVTDLEEPPATPEAPTVSHHRQRHLRVSWEPPANTGPPINDYDVQYRVKDTGNPDAPWSDHAFTGTGNTTTLSGLLRDTPYEARVLARNDEGDSDWSPAGEGSTLANIPPVFGETDPAEREVPENSAVGTAVGNPVAATDEDIHDEGEMRYSLEGADASDFSIDPETGQIQVLSPLDHETRTDYQVTVEVIDNQTGSATITVNITVTDLQEKPGTPEDPGVTAGAYANTLAVTWEEPGNTGPPISDYDIRYREASESNWRKWDHEGTARTSTIRLLRHGTTHDVQVRAYNDERWSSWSGSGSGDTAANRSPLFGSSIGSEAVLSLPETEGANTDPGRDIGSPLTATDPDNDGVSYSLEGTEAAKFTVSSTTGQISSRSGESFDHETKETYEFTLVANDDETDNTGRSTVGIEVRITDVDEPPIAPTITGFTDTQRYHTTVSWDPPDNTGRPEITGYQLQYKLNGINVYDDDNILTAERDDNADLLTSHTASNLDDGKTYNFRVRANNAEGEGDWSEASNVSTPPNKIPVFQEGETTTRELPENSDEDTTVGLPVTATDGDGDNISYSITGENEGVFAIDHRDGGITAGDYEYDHEGTNSYTITVTADDGEGGVADIEVTISITDISEPPDAPGKPRVTAPSSITLDVDWDAPDNDGRPEISSHSVRYRQKVEPGEEQNDWRDSGYTGTDTQATIEDLEPSTTYEVQVQAQNDEGKSNWSKTSEGTTRANVPPAFTDGSSTSRDVAENTGASQNVGAPVAATDVEKTDLTYTLEGADKSSFTIVSSTGQIRTGSGVTYNYESSKRSYSVTVKATDQHGGSSTIGVTVNVTDEDEPPDKPADPNVVAGTAARTLAVTWAKPGGTGPEVTGYGIQYRAKDATSWSSQTHSGTTRAATIQGLTAGTTYEVQVNATNDEGTGDWSDSGEGKTNPNITPTFNDDQGAGTTTRSVPETTGDNTDTGRSVGARVAATDADGGSITYSLGGTDAGKFSIDADTGQISTRSGEKYDHETRDSYSVTVTANDGQEQPLGSRDITVTITVTDRDEPPTKPGTPTFSDTSRYQTTLAWTAPNNTGRPDITGYQVRYGTGTDISTHTTQDAGNNLTLTVDELDDGRAYSFQVRAKNAEGDGEWSTVASESTPANRGPAFSDGSAATRSLPENSSAGTDVGQAVGATDGDSDELTYSITGLNPGSLQGGHHHRATAGRKPRLQPRGHHIICPDAEGGGRPRRRGHHCRHGQRHRCGGAPGEAGSTHGQQPVADRHHLPVAGARQHRTRNHRL